MVVIPTKTHVSLHYSNTPVDYLGWTLTLLGIGALIVMWRMGPVLYPSQPAHRRRRWLSLSPLRSASTTAPGADVAGNGGGVVTTEHAGSGDGGDSPEAAYSAALGKQLSGVNGDAHGPPPDVDSYWD
jgi:hypothetical protein